MKKTYSTLSVFLFSLFFFVFAIKYSPVSAADDNDSVIDINGEALREGVQYHIHPAIWTMAGGPTARKNRNGTFCQFDVVLESYPSNFGTPVTFRPVEKPNEGIIRVSTELHIEFRVDVTICMPLLVWQVAELDKATKQYFVTTGNPVGFEMLKFSFKIERIDDVSDGVYKLVACPVVSDLRLRLRNPPPCKDIGIYVDPEDRTRRLASLSDKVEKPLAVVFIKKGDTLIHQKGSNDV